MSNSSYPLQLYEAARVYHDSCNAYASFRATPHDFIVLGIQAPEIMMQFIGDVEFGKDPKGRLFYKSDLKWPTARDSTYTIFYYRTSTPSVVVVRVDFYALRTDGKLTPFARFLANVKVSELPPIVPGLGQGRWAQLKAVTCRVLATRRTDHTTLYLESESIHKQAYFTSQANTPISQSGILFFPVLARLKTQPSPGDDYCVANYSRDRILFHIENREDEVVALFLPNKPITAIGPMPATPRVTWLDIPYPPPGANLSGTDVEDDSNVVDASA